MSRAYLFSCFPVNSRGAQQRLGLLLGIVVILAYASVWRAGFIWDDDYHLTENACIIGPLGFRDIWTSAAAYYYPMVLTSFWLQHAIWGLNPAPYHLFTIAVHAACAIVLWRVLRRLQVPAPWLGAAFWALHPVQVESVAWVTELKNTQSALFFLLAIFFFLRWRDACAASHRKGAGLNYVLVLICAFLAYTSKTSTVMLPVILALSGWWLDDRWEWRSTFRLTPVFGLSAAAAGWTIWEQRVHSGASGAEWNQTVVERFLIAGKATWFYLGKLLWPQPLMFIYPRWTVSASQALDYLPLVGVAILSAVLWYFRRGWAKPAFYAFACFLVLLFPVLGFFNVYFFRYSFVADHFQYLASIAPLVLFAGVMARLAASLAENTRRIVEPAGAAALLGILAALTWRQGPIYRNNSTLWNDALAKNPRCWLAHINLGKGAAEDGHGDEAIDRYRKALALNHAYWELHNLLGNTLLDQHRLDEAAEAYREALAENPKYADAHNNLGGLLLNAGRTSEAIAHFERALEANPESAEAHNGIGNAFLQTGQTKDAIHHFSRALAIAPDFVIAHYNLGNALVQSGQLANGIRQYQRGLALEPDDIDLHTNLGVAFYNSGRHAEAIYHFRRVLAATPGSAGAHNNLGNALREIGRPAEAVAHYRRAIELDPKFIRAYWNAAWLLATSPEAGGRDAAEAVALAEQANRLTSGHDPQTRRILAAAYAEAGRYSEAVQIARHGLALGAEGSNPAFTDQLRRELEYYLAGSPYRDFPRNISPTHPNPSR